MGDWGFLGVYVRVYGGLGSEWGLMGSGRSVEGVWRVSGGSLAGFWRVSRRCLERGLGRVSGVFGRGLGGV